MYIILENGKNSWILMNIYEFIILGKSKHMYYAYILIRKINTWLNLDASLLDILCTYFYRNTLFYSLLKKPKHFESG